ncbi:DUF6684 family protein [Salinirubrum litoreum]|uniref:DUF6684 family protein n=1 Tax=Salinirubrum litoreum TaxID=1126234 RepID=A0ABD5R6U0_9EURY
MANRIFDKDTLLDLTVNIIPLFIILFFVVVFAVINPWGFDALGSGLQYALLIAPFVALAVLTYLSGKAIAGAEKSGTVFLPGQANVEGAKPLHEREAEAEALESGEAAQSSEVESAEETPELEGEDAATQPEDDEVDAENTEAAADDADAETDDEK